jgi:hypothetical protein
LRLVAVAELELSSTCSECSPGAAIPIGNALIDRQEDALLLLGLQVHHGSGLSSGWTLFCALVAAQVAALQPVNENLCLLNVSAQRGCFNPHRACPAVPAGDILTLDPN